jgi:OmpA-OmpF porin, OOP family
MDIRSKVLCSLLVMGTAAHAEGLYVLGSVGVARFDQDISQSEKNAYLEDNTGVPVLSSSQDRSDSAYKLQVGYQFNENFAIEGGYVDLGQLEYKADFGSSVFAKEEASAKGLNIAALLTLPVNAGFSLFVKAGIINAEVKEKIAVIAPSFYEAESEKARNVKPNFGIGVAYNFYQGFSARLEAERFSKLGDDDKTGEFDVDFYSLGLSYKF